MGHSRYYFLPELLDTFHVLAVNIDAASFDKASLLHIIHRMLYEGAFSGASRPRNTHKLLVIRFLKELFDKCYLFRVNNWLQNILNFRCRAPQLRSFFLKSRIPTLKVPIYIASIFLILRYQNKILSLILISEFYLSFCSLEARVNLTLFLK